MREEMGFLAYVEKVAPNSGDLMFPLLRPGGPDRKLGFYFTKWTVLKTWQIGSFSDSIGLDGFGAKACGGSQGFSISMIG